MTPKTRDFGDMALWDGRLNVIGGAITVLISSHLCYNSYHSEMHAR